MNATTTGDLPVMTSLRPRQPLEQPARVPAAHRAPVEAIDVLLADVQRLSAVSQLLPHGRRCGCQRSTCQR